MKTSKTTFNNDQQGKKLLGRLLRDSHLDLKIETLKENSLLILGLDSQFFHENSHSQLSFSYSQKYESRDVHI